MIHPIIVRLYGATVALRRLGFYRSACALQTALPIVAFAIGYYEETRR